MTIVLQPRQPSRNRRTDQGRDRSGLRILVTGGAGFVGSHLCDALLAQGHAVVCLDNLRTGRRSNVAHLRDRTDFTLLEHDVTEPLPRLGHVDQVFALASAALPAARHRLGAETVRACARGAEHALHVALASGGRFVLASTSEVDDDPEDVPVGRRREFVEAKQLAEALTEAFRRSLGTDTAIARIVNPYGPRMRNDEGRTLPRLIRQGLAGQPLTVTGTGAQTRSLCYVGDAVRGVLALARSDEAGPIALGNPEEHTVTHIAEEIRRLTGGPAPLEFVPVVGETPGQPCPDITAARERLGWSPRVSLREGLHHTIVAAGGNDRAASAIAVLSR